MGTLCSWPPSWEELVYPTLERLTQKEQAPVVTAVLLFCVSATAGQQLTPMLSTVPLEFGSEILTFISESVYFGFYLREGRSICGRREIGHLRCGN